MFETSIMVIKMLLIMFFGFFGIIFLVGFLMGIIFNISKKILNPFIETTKGKTILLWLSLLLMWVILIGISIYFYMNNMLIFLTILFSVLIWINILDN